MFEDSSAARCKGQRPDSAGRGSTRDRDFPGLSTPAALIGVAEKGYLSVKLEATATPGYSSMPPAVGRAAIAQISQALARLDSQPMPGAVRGVAAEMFDTLAPEFSGFSRVALSNCWLFGRLLQRQFEKSASTNATLRATTALTVVSGGNKDNVLPARAEAVVNFRILPGDTRSGAIEYPGLIDSRVIANDDIVVTTFEGPSRAHSRGLSPPPSSSWTVPRSRPIAAG